jgi:hypothetical protein
LQNFARKCGATQDQPCPSTSSSPAFWGETLAPDKINDGDISTFWHSGGESESLYLKIDLQRVVNMQYVRITPRQGGHQSRLTDLTVRVGDNPNAYDNTVCGDVGSWSDGDNDSRDISCVASGRYIFLTDGPADKTTNVAELEAWGSVCGVPCHSKTVTECESCPTDMTSPAGSTSADSCECPANTYLDAEQCTSCPANSNSPSGSTSLSNCACDANYEQDWGVITDEYVEEKTGVKGWTLAKHLTADDTKWYTADYMQQASNPDWTEILLTRALGTPNEKWVRLSRSTWDFIAASDEVRPGQTNSYDRLMIEVIDMYPAEESKTVMVYPRNSVQTMGGAPYIFMPPINPSNWPSSHAERRASMIYAQHTDYLYNRDTYWPDRKTGVVDGSLNTISEEFKVFVRYSEFTCSLNCPTNTHTFSIASDFF